MISETYCKLSSGIVFSSLWGQDSDTCKIWITMLALKNREGIVTQNITGISRISGVPLEKCEQAIVFLCSPDPKSSSAELEGRRLQAVDGGGWRVVNHQKYQEMGWSDDKRMWERDKKQRYRDRRNQDHQPRFKKPTLEDLVTAGMDQNNAERFLNYYESKGWKVGKSPMKDWQAAVRNWMKNNNPKPAPSRPLSYEEILKESQK